MPNPPWQNAKDDAQNEPLWCMRKPLAPRANRAARAPHCCQNHSGPTGPASWLVRVLNSSVGKINFSTSNTEVQCINFWNRCQFGKTQLFFTPLPRRLSRAASWVLMCFASRPTPSSYLITPPKDGPSSVSPIPDIYSRRLNPSGPAFKLMKTSGKLGEPKPLGVFCGPVCQRKHSLIETWKLVKEPKVGGFFTLAKFQKLGTRWNLTKFHDISKFEV